MFSISLSEEIFIQDLVFQPVIKLKHYYLHQFEAKYFVENPLETYINVIGINDIEIFNGTTFKNPSKNMTAKVTTRQMLPHRKKNKKCSEPELESTDESDNESEFKKVEITEKKVEPKTKLHSVVTVKEAILPFENKNPSINQTLADERNKKSKAESTVQTSENNSLYERNNKSQAKNVQLSENKNSDVRNHTSQVTNVQPSENKSPNIQISSTELEAFVGNGKTASLITSLTLTKNSPLIRGCVKICGAITLSARGCSYRRCRLKDSSGEISCVIFEPICTAINNFLKIGAIIEVENAVVDELPVSMSTGNERYKLNFRPSSKVALYLDNTRVYEHPPVMPSMMTYNGGKYKSLQSIKSSIRSVDRVDAIGVLIWMSQLLDVRSNNRCVKCRNIRIEDESGSALVSLWENVAETVNFPIGSIVSAKRARLKMIRDDIEFVIDMKAKISLAEDCEEKTRLQKWYQPAARRMIPKI
ncbi:uncharacterized protein [Chelonus insularis]|nr:uncharacterized protein LOC118074221 isoform X2 [Chelonus insularis]